MEYARRSRGLAVECAVLGYLVEAPAHGYELRERLAEGLGAFWRIASSQLYQVLHRLEEEDWVESSADDASGGPTRTVYRVTGRGAAAFWDWATSPVRHVRQIRVEFWAKAYFLRRLAPERLADLIASQIGVLRELDAGLKSRATIETDDATLGRAAVAYRRHQVEQTIGWLEANRESLLGGKECT